MHEVLPVVDHTHPCFRRSATRAARPVSGPAGARLRVLGAALRGGRARLGVRRLGHRGRQLLLLALLVQRRALAALQVGRVRLQPRDRGAQVARGRLRRRRALRCLLRAGRRGGRRRDSDRVELDMVLARAHRGLQAKAHLAAPARSLQLGIAGARARLRGRRRGLCGGQALLLRGGRRRRLRRGRPRCVRRGLQLSLQARHLGQPAASGQLASA